MSGKNGRTAKAVTSLADEISENLTELTEATEAAAEQNAQAFNETVITPAKALDEVPIKKASAEISKETPKVETPKAEVSKEVPKVEAPKAEVSKKEVSVPKVETLKAEVSKKEAPAKTAEVKASVEAPVVAEFVQAATGPLPEASEVKPKNGRRPKATESKSEEEAESEVGFAPKTFLTPYVLLMLRDSLMHGYAIWEKLMVMGIPGLDESDRATIYRTLRQLEREGKVKSEWDTATEGPARRMYSLTASGESFLQIWAVGLDQYRQSLDFFFKMYTGGTLPSPFGFKFTNQKLGSNKPKGEQ